MFATSPCRSQTCRLVFLLSSCCSVQTARHQLDSNAIRSLVCRAASKQQQQIDKFVLTWIARQKAAVLSSAVQVCLCLCLCLNYIASQHGRAWNLLWTQLQTKVEIAQEKQRRRRKRFQLDKKRRVKVENNHYRVHGRHFDDDLLASALFAIGPSKGQRERDLCRRPRQVASLVSFVALALGFCYSAFMFRK